jgi:hypothetical protein
MQRCPSTRRLCPLLALPSGRGGLGGHPPAGSRGRAPGLRRAQCEPIKPHDRPLDYRRHGGYTAHPHHATGPVWACLAVTLVLLPISARVTGPAIGV